MRGSGCVVIVLLTRSDDQSINPLNAATIYIWSY